MPDCPWSVAAAASSPIDRSISTLGGEQAVRAIRIRHGERTSKSARQLARRPAFHRSAALGRAAARATTTESLASLSQPRRLPYCARERDTGSEPRGRGLIIAGTGGGPPYHRLQLSLSGRGVAN